MRIVLLGIPSGDCGVSEEFRALSSGSAREDADYVIFLKGSGIRWVARKRVVYDILAVGV